MKKTNKFSPEVRERAVRMVQEQRGEYPSATHRVQPCSGTPDPQWMRAGKVRGSFTGCILAISSMRPSVMSKKNFSPVSVALSDTGDEPVAATSAASFLPRLPDNR